MGASVCATTRPRLAREGRTPHGAGHVPAGEPEAQELVVWHEFFDQRKELSLLKSDVCVKQLPRSSQRLSINDAGRHGDFEFASEPLELHVLHACLAEGSRLRLDVPDEKREELFFLIPKVDTLFVPEKLHEFPGRRKSSRSITIRGSTAQPHCLDESFVMVARERDQGGVTLHCTLGGRDLGRLDLYLTDRFTLIQLVRFRRHDEIVAMKAFDLVRPPCDRRPTPFGQQRRVMRLFRRELANLVREFQRLRKVVDRKDASQAFDSTELHDVPVRDLAMKLGGLGIRHGRCVLAARNALHLPQCLHLLSPLELAPRKGLLVGSEYRSRYALLLTK